MEFIKINNQNISKENMAELIRLICEKKEFQNISNKLVEDEIIKLIKKSSKLTKLYATKEIKNILKSKELKQTIKEVRKVLHKLHGMFNELNFEKREEIIENVISEKLTKPEFEDKIKEILEMHVSSKERINDYKKIYEKIFSILPKKDIRTILDIGCGFNPLSIPLTDINNVEYIASDINSEELKLINKFKDKFKEEYNVDILTKQFNLLTLDSKNEKIIKKQISNLTNKEVDLTIIFKVLEIIELNKSHRISENIIKNIPSKYLVVSFPTKTMTNKPMNFTNRGWMHLMLERLEYKYDTFEEENELFFVINKT